MQPAWLTSRFLIFVAAKSGNLEEPGWPLIGTTVWKKQTKTFGPEFGKTDGWTEILKLFFYCFFWNLPPQN